MNTALDPAAVANRDPKARAFMDIVAATYAQAGLSVAEAQRVNDAPGLADCIAGFIAEHRIRKEFKDEEVLSDHGYFSGYRRAGDLHTQCDQIRILFPGIDFADQDLLARIENGKTSLPPDAEGWFAIPNWKRYPEIFGPTYSSAVRKVLDTIQAVCPDGFYNYRDGKIDAAHLRQSARSGKFWSGISQAQGDADILILAAQFGLRHRGRSARRARVVIEDTPGEFGLGAFALGIMLLTHPIRLQHHDDLWIDCAGDEFAPCAGGGFLETPSFGFYDGKIKFGANDVDDAYGRYGSASGFAPELSLRLESWVVFK